jgi:hypothetical protein
MRHSHKRLFNVAGKLPATTGWQPVLPTSFGIKRSARNRGPIAQDDGKRKVGELTPKAFGVEPTLRLLNLAVSQFSAFQLFSASAILPR